MRQETTDPDILRFYDMISEIDPRIIKTGCFTNTNSEGAIIEYMFCFSLKDKDALHLADTMAPQVFEVFNVDDMGIKTYGLPSFINQDLELYRERLYNRIYYEYNDHKMPDDENSYSNNRPANLKPYIDN